MTQAEQNRLARYANDLPSLWNAPGTEPRDRKRIVRCLIENVVVTVPKDGPNLHAAVHWVGGEMTDLAVRKGRTGEHRHVAEVELVELITSLAKEFSDEQIAFILRRKKILTPKDLPFTTQRVTSTRTNHGIPGQSVERLVGKDVYTADKAAEILGTSRATVVRWVQDGLLHGSQVTPQAPWHIRVTDEDRRRLTAAAAPAGWLPLKGAAQALGVSQPTVLQRLKDGRMEAVRVRVGRRSGWRIHVPETTCDDPPTLFEPATS